MISSPYKCSLILGCVPLVSPVGSVREIIKDGYNGYYISPDDIEGIIDRIKSIVSGVRPSFDKIVVSMHWGEEYTNIPPSYVLYQPVASPMHDAYIKEVTEYLADCYEEADAGAYDETVRRNVSAGHNKNRIRMRVRMLSHFWNYLPYAGNILSFKLGKESIYSVIKSANDIGVGTDQEEAPS